MNTKKDLCRNAISYLKLIGVGYADVRYTCDIEENILFKDGFSEKVTQITQEGVGVRVLHNGSWGFAATNIVSEESIVNTAKKAIDVAKASSILATYKVKLAEQEPYIAQYKTIYEVDPFIVPLEQKLELLQKIDQGLKIAKEVTTTDSNFNFFKQKKLFLSSDGSEIEQEILHSGFHISAIAKSNTDVQRRSFNDYIQGGYEFIEGSNLVSVAEKISNEAKELLTADLCPTGKKTIIIGGEQLVLQVHESCGHPIELDRALGMEAGFYGTSFLTTDKLNKFKYGSEKVNITADATQPTALGGFGYDDEGVPAQRVDIIKDGIFVNYISSRETAIQIGKKSNGAMRAQSYNVIPLIRMTSINLEPGEWDFDELIADTNDGIFLDTNKSWSIDEKRLNFHFGCEIAWEIKNGKKNRLLKNPFYSGITPEFWNSCDAVCNKNHWHIWGVPNCGKGQPGQTMRVSHGTAPARFLNVNVGSK